MIHFRAFLAWAWSRYWAAVITPLTDDERRDHALPLPPLARDGDDHEQS